MGSALKPNLYWVWRLPDGKLVVKQDVSKYVQPLNPIELYSWNRDHPEQQVERREIQRRPIMQAITLDEFKTLIGRSGDYTWRRPFRGAQFN